MGYLDEVVDATEPAVDPHNMKAWYRSELLRDDGAIDRIFRNLREKAKSWSGTSTKPKREMPSQLRFGTSENAKKRCAARRVLQSELAHRQRRDREHLLSDAATSQKAGAVMGARWPARRARHARPLPFWPLGHRLAPLRCSAPPGGHRARVIRIASASEQG